MRFMHLSVVMSIVCASTLYSMQSGEDALEAVRLWQKTDRTPDETERLKELSRRPASEAAQEVSDVPCLKRLFDHWVYNDAIPQQKVKNPRKKKKKKPKSSTSSSSARSLTEDELLEKLVRENKQFREIQKRLSDDVVYAEQVVNQLRITHQSIYSQKKRTSLYYVPEQHESVPIHLMYDGYGWYLFQERIVKHHAGITVVLDSLQRQAQREKRRLFFPRMVNGEMCHIFVGVEEHERFVFTGLLSVVTGNGTGVSDTVYRFIKNSLFVQATKTIVPCLYPKEDGKECPL